GLYIGPEAVGADQRHHQPGKQQQRGGPQHRARGPERAQRRSSPYASHSCNSFTGRESARVALKWDSLRKWSSASRAASCAASFLEAPSACALKSFPIRTSMVKILWCCGPRSFTTRYFGCGSLAACRNSCKADL